MCSPNTKTSRMLRGPRPAFLAGVRGASPSRPPHTSMMPGVQRGPPGGGECACSVSVKHGRPQPLGAGPRTGPSVLCLGEHTGCPSAGCRLAGPGHLGSSRRGTHCGDVARVEVRCLLQESQPGVRVHHVLRTGTAVSAGPRLGLRPGPVCKHPATLRPPGGHVR